MIVQMPKQELKEYLLKKLFNPQDIEEVINTIDVYIQSHDAEMQPQVHWFKFDEIQPSDGQSVLLMAENGNVWQSTHFTDFNASYKKLGLRWLPNPYLPTENQQ